MCCQISRVSANINIQFLSSKWCIPQLYTISVWDDNSTNSIFILLNFFKIKRTMTLNGNGREHFITLWYWSPDYFLKRWLCKWWCRWALIQMSRFWMSKWLIWRKLSFLVHDINCSLRIFVWQGKGGLSQNRRIFARIIVTPGSGDDSKLSVKYHLYF